MNREELLQNFVAWTAKHITGDKKGEKVTAPGIPAGYPQAQELVTADCIQPG